MSVRRGTPLNTKPFYGYVFHGQFKRGEGVISPDHFCKTSVEEHRRLGTTLVFSYVFRCKY